jgi:hypothetical protein
MSGIDNEFEEALHARALKLGAQESEHGDLLAADGRSFRVSVEDGLIGIWGEVGCWRSIDLANPDSLQQFDEAVTAFIN